MEPKRRDIAFIGHNVPHEVPPFLRLFNPLIKIFRVLGLFPESSGSSPWLNWWHYIIIGTLFVTNMYFITYKIFMIVKEMLTKITASAIVQLALYIWFGMVLSCNIFVFQTGRKKKLELFSDLLYEATKQKALENKFVILRRNLILFTFVQVVLAVSVSLFLPVIFLCEFANSWPGVEGFRTLLFLDVWYFNCFIAIVIAYNSIANGIWMIIYVTTCDCLKEEFVLINEKIRKLNIRDSSLFKEVAFEHSRLLKCLSFLREYLSTNIFICLSSVTVTSIIFAYIVMLDVDASVRCLCGFWLFGNFTLAFIFCNSAESLSTAARETKEIVCSKMAEEHKKCDLDDATFKTGSIITQQTNMETGISALGFFLVSKESLLALFSFVATYVVIMIQSPTTMGESSANLNQNQTLSF